MDRQQLQLVLEGSSLPFQIASLADFRFKTYITAHSYTSQSLATIPLIYISCWFCFSGGILHGTGGLGKFPVPREGKMNQGDRIILVSGHSRYSCQCAKTLIMFSPLSIVCHRFYCSVAQSCLTLCGPVDCSTPGFPVLHHLLELDLTHVPDLSQGCHPTISSSVIPFSCFQYFPASGSFF